jgi:hypothetical protein
MKIWKCLRCHKTANELWWYNGPCDVFEFCWDCMNDEEIEQAIQEKLDEWEGFL